MPGSELSTLVDELNGGSPIGDTLKFQLINAYKNKLELVRPWMVLRATDTSKSVTTANTWQTEIDLSTIAWFSRFVGDWPVKLFNNGQIHRYRQVPMKDRLEYSGASDTFVYIPGTKKLYLNGSVPFAGTLYIHHIALSAPLSEGSSASVWPFPGDAHALLAHGAVAIHKGGVDYDEVNARQLVMNNAEAMNMLRAIEKWDSDLQLGEIDQYDPYDSSGPQANRVIM